jgi:hypothetical protein
MAVRVTRPPARGSVRRQDERDRHRRPREDDVSEPGTPSDVPDADRAEQEALVDPPDVALASEATSPAADVPEADALEQQLAARPGEAGTPRPVGDREANEADVLEQEADVPVDEDDALS